MSRGEETHRASHRAVTTGATFTTAAPHPGGRASVHDTPPPAGGRGLIRVALYARVSIDKQEREDTVASPVDLLRQTAEARGYAGLPGNIFIADGVSGARLERPALERWRDLAAAGACEVVLVTAPDRLARRYASQVVLVEERWSGRSLAGVWRNSAVRMPCSGVFPSTVSSPGSLSTAGGRKGVSSRSSATPAIKAKRPTIARSPGRSARMGGGA